MSWEDVLKGFGGPSPKVWKRFVVKLFKESPNRSMTATQVVSKLINDSTISGTVYKPQKGGNVKQETMKYSNVPTVGKLRAFLRRDNRFRIISKIKTDEYVWAGE